MTQDLTSDLYKVQRMFDDLESIIVTKTALLRKELEKLRDKARSLDTVASPKAVLTLDEEIHTFKGAVDSALERLEQLEV